MIAKIDDETGLLVTEDGGIYRKVSEWEDKFGYKAITEKHKNIFVHRLVAKAFCDGRTKEKDIVMHLDNNPKNNHFSNLKWGSYSENNQDAWNDNLKSGNFNIMCMETGVVYPSGREAARQLFGKDKQKRGDHILEVARGVRGSAYGYHWSIVERG